MPWLVGGGVLLALLLGKTSAVTPALSPAAQQPTSQPYTPSLQAHLATVVAQPRKLTPVAQVNSSTFTLYPYGIQPPRNTLWWWINRFTGSDYKTGEDISIHDLDDAMAHALKLPVSQALTLCAFAAELASYGSFYQVDSQEEEQTILDQTVRLAEAAVAPYVAHYGGVAQWPLTDPSSEHAAGSANATDEATDAAHLLATINAVKAHAGTTDMMNLGALLAQPNPNGGGFIAIPGANWEMYGQQLIALAKTPKFQASPQASTPSRVSPPPALHAVAPVAKQAAHINAPPPPAKKPIAKTPVAPAHPHDVTAEVTTTTTPDTSAVDASTAEADPTGGDSSPVEGG